MSSNRNLRAILTSFLNWPDEDADAVAFELPEIQAASYATSFGIPPPPEPSELLSQSRKTWVPPGTPVTIAGRVIPQGALYVGEHLSPISGWETVDPALIDPTLPVEGTESSSGGFHSFYSMCYGRITPINRARYLDWLATGQPPTNQTSYAYIRLHALERRILFDARYDKTAKEEMPALIREIRMLEKRAGDEFFKFPVAVVLTASLLLHGVPTIEEIEPVIHQNGWDLPMPLLVGLGIFAKRRQPLPAEWAFSWICSDPKTSLRTAATRLPDEFRQLFSYRYAERFPGGMLVTPPKPRLDVYLSPSSSTFGGGFSVPDPDLSDLGRARKPQKQLRELLNAVNLEIDDYSRTVGSSGDKNAPLALAARPSALGSIVDNPSLVPLAQVLGNALGERSVGLVEVQQLIGSIPGLSQPPTQKQSSVISRLSRRLGYGLAPDPGAARTAFINSERIGIYRQGDTDAPPPDLSVQQLALSLGALLIGVDGKLDGPARRDLLALVLATDPVTAEDTDRLRAYLRWLADRPISLAEAKRQWNQMEIAVDPSLLTMLIQVAARDGDLSSGEMHMLAKLYPLFGRNEQQLHSDLHQYFAGNASAAPTGPSRKQSPAKSSKRDQVVDAHVVRHVQKQTDEIQSVLGAIFSEDEPEAPAQPRRTAAKHKKSDPYAQLIAALAGRSECTMDELTTLASSFGLMPSGAIETLNDRAVALGLDPLFDCNAESCRIDADSLTALLRG